MTVVVVEGESDRAALEVLSERMSIKLPPVIVLGGAHGIRRPLHDLEGQDVLGLVDANERHVFEDLADEIYVCEPDLEGELTRALGVAGVEAVIAAQGELASYRRLQGQPAQRQQPADRQLARFLGGRSGNKLRYARLLAAAVPLERTPPPLAALLRAAAQRQE